jgi:hypothetical protein
MDDHRINADEHRTCPECGGGFVLTRGEQQWFAERARREPGRAWSLPKRCRPCREAARLRRLEREDW